MPNYDACLDEKLVAATIGMQRACRPHFSISCESLDEGYLITTYTDEGSARFAADSKWAVRIKIEEALDKHYSRLDAYKKAEALKSQAEAPRVDESEPKFEL